MKIGIVGKGGSGKTTASALLARHCASHNFPTLAIDADINQHLAEALGMEPGEAQSIPPLGMNIDIIKEYLRGDNKLIPSLKHMIKTTPPGIGSRLLYLSSHNPLWERFACSKHGVNIIATGPFDTSDIGVHCYHSKTGAVELILNHLIDRTGEFVIVDMTAGADAFASGIFTRFDVLICVVEPTRKSIEVYDQYKLYGKEYDINLKVVGNKIENVGDKEFLSHHIDPNNMIAYLPISQWVKKQERGSQQPIEELEPTYTQEITTVISYTQSLKKDWAKYYRQAAEFHIKNVHDWAHKHIGYDIRNQAHDSHPYIPSVVSV